MMATLHSRGRPVTLDTSRVQMLVECSRTGRTLVFMGYGRGMEVDEPYERVAAEIFGDAPGTQPRTPARGRA